jgi:hypothetical protein
MKTVLAIISTTTLLLATPAAAQLGGSGTSITGSAGGPNPQGAGPTRREVRPAVRDFRDRPFGSMATGTIMGSTGTDSAMGTAGSIGSGTGHGAGIGIVTGPGQDLGSTGYRFSPTASPGNPPPVESSAARQ